MKGWYQAACSRWAICTMRDAVESRTDPRDQLRAMVFAKFDHIQRLRTVFEITGEVGREITQLYHQHKRRFLQQEERMIETILRRGQQMGIFRPGPPRPLARCLRSLFARYEFEIAFDTESEDLRGQFDIVLNLIFDGIAIPGHSEGESS